MVRSVPTPLPLLSVRVTLGPAAAGRRVSAPVVRGPAPADAQDVAAGRSADDRTRVAGGEVDDRVAAGVVAGGRERGDGRIDTVEVERAGVGAAAERDIRVGERHGVGELQRALEDGGRGGITVDAGERDGPAAELYHAARARD